MLKLLRRLRQTTPAVTGCALVGKDGVVIASLLPGEVDQELVSGMAAAMLGVGERIAAEILGSKMEQTYVRGENGYVILNAVGRESVLVVLASSQAQLGLIFIDVRRLSSDLAALT
jgi:predicted regulator of Ras-like GTPase activity (Roadblock/LC7/MglB family)